MDIIYTIQLTEPQYATLWTGRRSWKSHWRTCSSRPCKIS